MTRFAIQIMQLFSTGFFRLFRLPLKRRCTIDYQPDLGQKSDKAERLANYCLGDFHDKAIQRCTKESRYLQQESILLIETDARGILTFSHTSRCIWDQKKVVEAWVSQRSKIPTGISSWLVRGDGAGRRADPEKGLHITGMRLKTRRDLVLVPTANRDRYLGPNLQKQMEDLRQFWVPWEKKSDSAWWGGALTGNRWRDHTPPILTRREVLCHFRDHPSDQVSLHMTSCPGKFDSPQGIKLEAPFTKASAFSHKCMLLLPGNDIASGSSWYFAGNSVVLMPKPHLDHILYFEMEPWEHYVPLKNDPADILTKLQWVLDNQERAQQIVANSHERLRWLCGQEFLWACNEVLRRISKTGAA